MTKVSLVHLTFIKPLLDNTAVADVYPQSVFGMLSAAIEKGALKKKLRA